MPLRHSRFHCFIVGHDTLHGNTEVGIISQSRLEKGNGAALLFVGQYLREGDARGLARGTNSQPAAPGLAPARAAVAVPAETAAFLDMIISPGGSRS